MRRLFVLLLFLMTFGFNSFGQVSNEKEVIGKWKVEKITEKPTNPQFKPLIDGFKNSTFAFNQNGNFSLTTTSKSEIFGMITQMTNDTKWKFEQKEQYVKIGNKEDNYSIMGISIKEVNGKKLFYLDESGMTLEMKKVE